MFGLFFDVLLILWIRCEYWFICGHGLVLNLEVCEADEDAH